ncbi:MAG: ComEC/Rec2 family competence protein [Candidatus Woesearchaeota archaeon]
MNRKTRHIVFALLIVLIVLLILFLLAFFLFYGSNYEKQWTTLGNISVVFFDVGQGDSILVQMPNGRSMLIDGGSLNSGPSLLEKIKSRGIKKIDVVVATHPDSDHIGGLLQIFQDISVGEYVYNCAPCTTETCLELEYYTADTQKNCVKKGDKILLQDGIDIKVLNPPLTLFEEDNDNSIVLLLEYGESSFLFTGDCMKNCEEALEKTEADVLKVAHHGSSSSTSAHFLSKVRPKIAVISVGENKYGHPSQKVASLLQDHGIDVFRTDTIGTIEIKTDGQKFFVNGQAE